MRCGTIKCVNICKVLRAAHSTIQKLTVTVKKNEERWIKSAKEKTYNFQEGSYGRPYEEASGDETQE